MTTERNHFDETISTFTVDESDLYLGEWTGV